MSSAPPTSLPPMLDGVAIIPLDDASPAALFPVGVSGSWLNVEYLSESFGLRFGSTTAQRHLITQTGTYNLCAPGHAPTRHIYLDWSKFSGGTIRLSYGDYKADFLSALAGSSQAGLVRARISAIGHGTTLASDLITGRTVATGPTAPAFGIFSGVPGLQWSWGAGSNGGLYNYGDDVLVASYLFSLLGKSGPSALTTDRGDWWVQVEDYVQYTEGEGHASFYMGWGMDDTSVSGNSPFNISFIGFYGSSYYYGANLQCGIGVGNSADVAFNVDSGVALPLGTYHYLALRVGTLGGTPFVHWLIDGNIVATLTGRIAYDFITTANWHPNYTVCVHGAGSAGGNLIAFTCLTFTASPGAPVG